MTSGSQTDFADAWRKYKLLRNTLIVLSLSFFFLGPLENVVASFGLATANAHFAVEGTWVVAEFFTAKALRSWKCPQCGKSFYGGRKSEDKFSTYWQWWFLPRQCVSCGLPRYSELPLQTKTSPNAAADA
jgi:hypothetical protein